MIAWATVGSTRTSSEPCEFVVVRVGSDITGTGYGIQGSGM